MFGLVNSQLAILYNLKTLKQKYYLDKLNGML